MTPQALWKIHQELDEIKRERQTQEEEIIKIIQVPPFSKEDYCEWLRGKKMTRPIDADELLKHIPTEEMCSRFAVVNAPTIDAVPVRHGKWIHDGYDNPHGIDWMHCSECGTRYVNCPASITNYCPNCGARMDERKEE